MVRVFINRKDLKSHQQWWRNFASLHDYFNAYEDYWEGASMALREWNAQVVIDRNRQPVLVFESDEALSFFLLRWS